jgi:hypothetical protein
MKMTRLDSMAPVLRRKHTAQRMSVVAVEDGADGGRHVALVKGSPEAMKVSE